MEWWDENLTSVDSDEVVGEEIEIIIPDYRLFFRKFLLENWSREIVL